MNKGFTLIELLIVVAIIGILAAVGAAVIPNILNKAKVTYEELLLQWKLPSPSSPDR
jgi:prepilin-type N-terminal cleavage/methylation domain-containing protein